MGLDLSGLQAKITEVVVPTFDEWKRMTEAERVTWLEAHGEHECTQCRCCCDCPKGAPWCEFQ